MDIIRLSGSDAKNHLMDGLFTIYSEALPPSEQKARDVLEQMLCNPNYYFYVLKNGNVVGFSIVYSPTGSDYCLLEYMAVDYRCRSEGYGGKVFDRMVEIFHDKTMVVEIESPKQKCDDAVIRQKRQVFYERHGCICVEDLNYILPLETGHTPPDMLILLNPANTGKKPENVSKHKLREWLTDIYVSVYGCNAKDERLETMFAG